MSSFLISIIAGTGLLTAIGVIFKFLLGSMGKHVDRLADSFETQTSRVVDQLKEVKSLTEKNARQNRREHRVLFERMDKDDTRHTHVVEQIKTIDAKINAIPCLDLPDLKLVTNTSLFACDHGDAEEPKNGNS